MKIFAKKGAAVLISAIATILIAGIFGAGDLRGLRNEALDYFKNGEEGNALILGVQYDLDERIADAKNLVRFAENYMSGEHELISAVNDSCEELKKAEAPDEKYAANEKLGLCCGQLNEYLYSNYTFKSSHSAYANKNFFISELEADNIRMKDSAEGYNKKAEEFNKTLSSFPASIMRFFGGVSKLGLFAKAE